MNDPSDKQGLTTRIGMISPDDSVNDDEYNCYLPKRVTLLWTRYRTAMRDEPISVEMVSSYGDLDVVRHAAQTLRITRPQVTAFLCNSCSFVHGPAGDERIREVIAENTGSKAVSISNAQVEALYALGARRVSVAAPYPQEVTAKLLDYLRACGFEVVANRSLGMTTEWQIGNTPPQHWLSVAREIDHPDAQALLFACSGIRIFEAIEQIEHACSKPMVAAPQAVIWHALRAIGIDTSAISAGRLYQLVPTRAE